MHAQEGGGERVCVHAYECLCTFVHAYLCVCMCLYARVFMHVCMCTCVSFLHYYL
jgi:hypothetical protein